MVENGSSDAPHVDEGTLHAWLDGALSADESRAVDAHVATCETCAAAAAEARGLIAASTRILSALDDVPGDVVPSKDQSTPALLGAQLSGSRPAKSPSRVRAYASIAAAAVVVVALTLAMRGKTATATHQASPVVARSAEADTASASAPALPERSATVASGVAKRADHTADPRVDHVDAQKSRVASAPESQAGAAAAVPGVAAAAKPAVSADSLTVKGRVTAAATGLPLADARVSVAGTRAGAATDSAGTFSVSVPTTGSHVLTARKIGFAASSAIVQLPADPSAQVTLALSGAANSLEAVVASAAAQHVDEFAKSPPQMTGAHVISSEVHDAGASRIRRTTFQLDSGATVSLVEIRSIAAAKAEDRSSTPARPDTQTRAERVMLRGRAGVSAASAPSITWVAGDSTIMILSGPLSTGELEQLRTRIVP